MKDLNKIVAHNIKNKLDEIKMSRADFATKLGTSLQGVNEIINCRRDITLTEIKEMAEILSLDINEFLKEDEIAAKDPVSAFRSSVKSSEALEGLRIAKKAMDLIIFHRDIQKEFNNILNE